MCRKNQLIGVALGAFGLGLLVASLFQSLFFCGCVGVGCITIGIVILQKK